GLVAALTAAAQRAPVAVTIDADSTAVGRFAAEVEAGAYFCCLEAIQNAAKHAGAAATVLVHVRAEVGGLMFDITDDGAGFVPGVADEGTGLTSMRDRIGALGGHLDIV